MVSALTTLFLMRECLVLAAMLMACSTTTEPENKPPPLPGSGVQCVKREHMSFLVKYTVRTGDCGEQAETILQPEEQPTKPPDGCAGQIEYSTNNCEVTYSSICPVNPAQPSAMLTVKGDSKWSDDASHGTAVESWHIEGPGGKVLCDGTYDVDITRQ